MTQIFQSELFDYLGKDIKSLDLYQDIFNSAEPKETDGSFYLSSPEKGIYVALSQALKVESIVLHAQGVDQYQQYQQDLPAGLSFDFSRVKVHELLGEPDKSGDAGGTGIFATPFSWDSYQMPDKYLSVQYVDGCNSIKTVTASQLQ
jgi:hypothetical protein